MKKWLLTSILLSVLLVLAACGGKDTSDESGMVDNTGSSEDANASTEINITGKNFEFDQAEYTVKAGEQVKIIYKNDEGMHGIAIDGLDVDIKGDGEASFTPTEPGEYTIYCNIPCGAGHADMKSTLIVT
ncbi:cupredoxin domain-containing protein [Sporosarcina sp. Marseille-Q4063]|uniref:cupredoxin domain-containing protein n=1 Tax=Sporosarcina sp. Marseille-Q4063 TaxID=2810514 RepID=UPI001BB094D4|nr:cupredoxin domain-containing protein [Sporosarcina sp. Marseille-Q4063]QUW23356.1 cupredoxin domain-containing protein [Sporosarcina sp. Marseille-Q4063]